MFSVYSIKGQITWSGLGPFVNWPGYLYCHVITKLNNPANPGNECESWILLCLPEVPRSRQNCISGQPSSRIWPQIARILNKWQSHTRSAFHCDELSGNFHRDTRSEWKFFRKNGLSRIRFLWPVDPVSLKRTAVPLHKFLFSVTHTHTRRSNQNFVRNLNGILQRDRRKISLDRVMSFHFSLVSCTGRSRTNGKYPSPTRYCEYFCSATCPPPQFYFSLLYSSLFEFYLLPVTPQFDFTFLPTILLVTKQEETNK